MRFEPETWIAEEYRGRAESGRTRPLRLSCSRTIDDAPESDEFFAKCPGLPEFTEQSAFCEIIGNLLARDCGITTPQPVLIEMSEPFLQVLQGVAGLRLPGGTCAGSRNLGPGISPPTFAKMSAEQLEAAARIYLFDLCTQNPDRRLDSPNAVVASNRLIAIDFEACFSFLYPILGRTVEPWQVSQHGIAERHLFHDPLRNATVEWPMLVPMTVELLDQGLAEADTWIPPMWRNWADRVRAHMMTLRQNEHDLLFEVVRSLS